MANSHIFLSYALGKEIPTYGNPRQELGIHQIKSMGVGDSCNTYRLSFENHWGTHIDCPAHFFDNTSTVVDYSASFWFFKYPQVVKTSVPDNLLITSADFSEDPHPDTDLLILKTGYGQYRGSPKYSCENPGLHADIGYWLRKDFPSIRVIGFDFISISSYQHRDEGRRAHREFLKNSSPGHPILILEDMSLEALDGELQEVVICPIRIAGIDSAPCTVMGVLG